MTVRFKLAFTVFAAGLLTALLVIVAVLNAFQRFEREITYRRASEFLWRVVTMYDDLFELHERQPDDFQLWLKNLVLLEPDIQLYLLDAAGTVLVSTGSTRLPAGFKVSLGPVRQAITGEPSAYVMGEDPERMDADAVIAAQPVRRSLIRNADEGSGYLYLVAHTSTLPSGRWAAVRASFGQPALGLIVGVVALTTLLAVWIIVAVTLPLRQLTEAVSEFARQGLEAGAGVGAHAPPLLDISPARKDEFGKLAAVFRALLEKLRMQWDALRRLDHFRREAVSNLSHDLRSPLTATVACLETLDARFAHDEARRADLQLLEVALRNTRNAARLVQSLGDLARLDEPEFKLRSEVVDLRELLDDIHLRFAARAAKSQVSLHTDFAGEPVIAAVDIELFERAVANLLDNALKFARAGDRVTLRAESHSEHVEIEVSDSGPGIAAHDLPHLFDRFYQSRRGVAPATSGEGKGLGLAIVKRIAELHGGDASVHSASGRGAAVRLRLPRERPGGASVAQGNP